MGCVSYLYTYYLIYILVPIEIEHLHFICPYLWPVFIIIIFVYVYSWFHLFIYLSYHCHITFTVYCAVLSIYLFMWGFCLYMYFIVGINKLYILDKKKLWHNILCAFWYLSISICIEYTIAWARWLSAIFCRFIYMVQC